MKIGELSRLSKVSKDTIRYYVKIGLLIPNKEHAQMDFSEREYNDLLYIQKMKLLKLNIKEIQAALTLRRLSNLIEPDTIQAYLTILDNKKNSMIEEMEIIQDALRAVQKEIDDFSKKKNKLARISGIPLKALEILRCPVCGGQLNVEKAEINHNYILRGDLCCECGYHADILNGIILTGNLYLGDSDHADLQRGLYRDVGDDFVTGFQTCSDLVRDEIKDQDYHNKVIMETNINGYFFLYNNFKDMNSDNLYIITDRYPEMLRMYKNLIDMLGIDLDILYIADDSLQFPIKDHSVDLLIDFFGSNEHFLYQKNSFLEAHQHFLKSNARILGALFGFDEGSESAKSVSSYYPDCNNNALVVMKMFQTSQKVNLRLEYKEVAAVTQTYQKYSFRCHKTGEQLRLYYYTAYQ